ncbi:hypothetical protein J4435_01650 [Candidatus Woesearchaeota archaeon]|nr:hypothetical protein [Candidatus Woesearchaeota archaeon]
MKPQAGDKVRVKSSDGEYEGILMPRPEIFEKVPSSLSAARSPARWTTGRVARMRTTRQRISCR